MTTYDWKASTFSLTVDDVARMLRTTPQSVIDLMLAGEIGFYMTADPGREGGPPMSAARFDPEDLTTYLAQDDVSYDLITLPVLTTLRHYLRDNPPIMDYDDALATGVPLSTRSGVHVRVQALVGYAQTTKAPVAAQMTTSVTTAFERMGLTRVRGLTPFGGTQRWGFWYRLPKVIAYEGQSMPLGDFLSPASALLPGETTIQAGDGSGPVVAQPVHSEADWDG